VRDDASPFEVGAALQRAVDRLQAVARIGAPELPGLERSGVMVRDLVSQYHEVHDYPTPKGRSWGGDCKKRVQEGVGGLTATELLGGSGELVIARWRDRMHKDGWRPKSVRNVLNFAKAALEWGQRVRLVPPGPLPKLPRFCREGEHMSEPDFTTLPEADFRHLRAHLFDEALRFQAFTKHLGPDRSRWADYIARRQLYLSFAFYTGAHPEDCNGCKGVYLSTDMGRYERHNTKSSRVVESDWFDMPEQLRLDCQAELARRGIPRFPEKEYVFCGEHGPWKEATRTLNKAVRRLWPGDPERKGFTFRIARRSTVWEYTIRGWRTHEIAALLGHVDETMIREVYRRCTQLSLISPVRVPWTLRSGPHGAPSKSGDVVPFSRQG